MQLAVGTGSSETMGLLAFKLLTQELWTGPEDGPVLAG